MGTVLFDSFRLLSSSYEDWLECIVVEEEDGFPLLGELLNMLCSVEVSEKYPETAPWQAKEFQQGAGSMSSAEENEELQ